MIASTPNTGREATLRVAVPKGALFADTVSLLETVGMPTGSLADPGRQLIVRAEGTDPLDGSALVVDYVIGKPTDIPIYVAYGAADVGFVGKDVLVEADVGVVEMVDLGYGACRFVVAEPSAAAGETAERYQHVGVVRVATKYPAIAEAHYAAKGVQAEIVKLNGNIEIAPLIGLADQVVDITATGTTLRENDLRIVEDVLPSTARFIANPISLRTQAARVTDLAQRLAAAVVGEEIA